MKNTLIGEQIGKYVIRELLGPGNGPDLQNLPPLA
jgi:hypothetical protein